MSESCFSALSAYVYVRAFLRMSAALIMEANDTSLDT